jgi:hypothetical protein
MTIERFWVEVSEPALRQGDLLPRCLVPIPGLDSAKEDGPREGTVIEYDLIVLTQSCDLEQRKVRLVATCPIFPLPEFEAVNPAFARKWVTRKEGDGCLFLLLEGRSARRTRRDSPSPRARKSPR